MLFPVFVGIDMLLCYYENHWGKILNFGAYFIKFNKIPISGFPSSDCDNMLFQPQFLTPFIYSFRILSINYIENSTWLGDR